MSPFWFYAIIWLLVVLIISAYCYYYYIKHYPKFCELTGPYKYVGVSYHRSPFINGARFKLYYPSSKYLVESNRSETAKYFKDGDEAAKGIQHLIGMIAINIPLLFIKSLTLSNYKKYPLQCYENAPIFIENMNDKQIYPLIILSHGLGASWDFYTQICCNLASFGLIVAAIEHNDGSASHCKLPSGSNFYYVSQHILNENGRFLKPSRSEWTREHTIKFRGQQTDKRVENIIDVYKYLISLNNIDNGYDIKLKKLIVPFIDYNHIFIVGHSFGGITAVMATKKLITNNNNKISGCIVFEPWFEPKSDDILMEEWKLPYLVIIGDEWTKRERLWNPMIMVINANKENENNKYFEYFSGFTHIDFCDGCLMAPQWILKRINACCKSLNVKQAQDLYCKRCIQFIAHLVPKWKCNKKYYIINQNERYLINNIDKTNYKYPMRSS